LETRKEKARHDLLDVERRIANLENERKAILADYEARGEALKADIIAKAEEAASQITTQARKTAQNEIDKAVAALRDELADKIIDAAGESIAGSLSPKDQEKLLNSFLNKVVLQ
ncbi:MAG: ATP synthase F0 subunit B, partial [Deltaproteobacteria bacterium]|nr:ATP synthase F0 subunit B [Deltaproteobacteria bacterium]